jgi:hypothetical protein
MNNYNNYIDKVKIFLKKLRLKHIIIFILILLLIEHFCRLQKKTLVEIMKPQWYSDMTKFPQKDFKCKRNCDEYNNRIDYGYKVMKTKKVIFGGLCINIADKVDILEKRFTHMGNYFDDYKVVIFENDSTDGTRDLLKDLCKRNDKFKLIECDEAKDCIFKTKSASEHGIFASNRMKKMVFYRNKVLNNIKKYNDFDCFCIIDLDLGGPISIDGIAHSFSHYKDWDAISANGLNGITLSLGQPVYYDYLAYKDDKIDTEKTKLDYLTMFYEVNKFKVGDPIKKVQSGFAGMSFYKMEILTKDKDINYTPSNDVYKCEHIIFHENMIKNGYDKIYINPNMLLLSGPQGVVKKYPFY